MGGFFPIGGGGFGFRPIVDATEDGLESFSPPKTGLRGGRPPGIGGAGGAPGGFGAAPCGGLGTELRDVSGSDRYGALLWSAPVLTPPAFLNFGMPPANKPPSCGADAIALSPPPVSLLLLARFPPPGTGGARPGGAGAFPMPGTGGAPPMGGPLGPLLTFPIVGADRSLICVTFFSLVPLPMSDSSAPRPAPDGGFAPGAFIPGIGGGGGGPPAPRPMGGMGGGGGGAGMMSCVRHVDCGFPSLPGVSRMSAVSRCADPGVAM